jgi:hypothetical protein
MDGTLVNSLELRVKKELAESRDVLGPEEAAVMSLIEKQLNSEDERKSA